MTPIDALNGLPGTIGEDGQFDGGDTAAILGTLWFFGQMTNKPLPFEMGLLVPLRHPDQSKWYGQPDRFSRDQLIAVLCGGIGSTLAPLLTLARLSASHRRKFFLTAWNTRGNGSMDMPKKFPDVTGPDVWALWLRIFCPSWARSVLWFLDLYILISAIQWRLFPTNNVCRNLMLQLLASQKVLPTFISRLSCKITNWNDLISRWRTHCEVTREYQTADLFEKYVKELKWKS